MRRTRTAFLHLLILVLLTLVVFALPMRFARAEGTAVETVNVVEDVQAVEGSSDVLGELVAPSEQDDPIVATVEDAVDAKEPADLEDLAQDSSNQAATIAEPVEVETSQADDVSTAPEDSAEDAFGELLVAEETVEEELAAAGAASNAAPTVSYTTHVQNVGWQKYVKNGVMAGTSGKAYRLEGIKVKLAGVSGTIEYRTHVQNIGWQDWVANDKMSGTSGKALRLEAIQIRLTGEANNQYDVYYRVHAQNFGWMEWAKNGASAGSAGYAYRLEGIQIVLVKKGGAAPSTSLNNSKQATAAAYKDKNVLPGKVNYKTHVQNVGWQNWVADGKMSGTQGKSYRLEGINIKLNGVTGGITYRTHVQNIGWQGWKKDGEMSGTSGRGLRLEAIQIKLTGEAAEKYDVYYRVHCQNIGWMGWARNGESAGSAGFSYRLEGIEIILVSEGDQPPKSTKPAYTEASSTRPADSSSSSDGSSGNESSSYLAPASVVYVTPAGKKYHRDTCKWVQGKNLRKYTSLAAAEKAGYKACNTCYPDGHS